MKIIKSKIPIYTGKLVIYRTNDLSKVQKKHNLESLNGFDGVFFQESDSSVYYIAFKGKPRMGVVAHESLHAMNAILKDHNVQLSIDNDEPQAYLIQWIVKQCCKVL